MDIVEYQISTEVESCNVIQWDGESHEVLNERAGELVHAFPNATEIREISVVWGPKVSERNYRITYGTPGNYHVSDWHVGWFMADNEIEFANEYDRIM